MAMSRSSTRRKSNAGRPTKYNAELQAKADQYLREWHKHDVIPTRVGLCCFIGICKQTSFDYETQHPEFSDTVRAIEDMQERVAVNRGLDGTFNSAITKVVLANHGYSDRVQQDNVSSDGSMSPKRIERVVVTVHEGAADTDS